MGLSEITDNTEFSAVLPLNHGYQCPALCPRPNPENLGHLACADERAEVFPGDTAYSQQLHFSLSPGCPVNVSRITLSPHTGAHADAPLHNGRARPALGAFTRHHSGTHHRLQRGTGGTGGVSYLRKMLDVVLFPEIWKLRTDL